MSNELKKLLPSELVRLVGKAAVADGNDVFISSLVAGRRYDGLGARKERDSPADGNLSFSYTPLDSESTEQAISVAREAFNHGRWGGMTGRGRSKILRQAALAVDDARNRLSTLLVVEAGKTVREARGEVDSLVNSLEYFSGLARTIGGRTENDIDADILAMTLREPAGVAGLIVPWNFPLGILGQKLPPALAAGNTVVLKPSPLTPLSALAVAEILFEAGLPEDALSVVLGDKDAGASIVESVNTDVVSFTGSTEVGRSISASAGTMRLKPVAIEAGGKTPVIVLDDADIESAVEGILFSAYFNQGQVCVAGSRILVERGIADEFSGKLAKRAGEILVGDPWSEESELGPLISKSHKDDVIRKVDASIEAGAEILTGSASSNLAELSAGSFLAPIVLRTNDDSNPSVAEELFGPVTTIQVFDSAEEALSRANAQRYGLAASIWGTSTDRLFALARKLRVGTVWINGSTDSYPEIPLGGRRDSGFSPEFGREGLEFFTVLKSLMIRTGGPLGASYGVGQAKK